MTEVLACDECGSLKFRSKWGVVCVSCFDVPSGGLDD